MLSLSNLQENNYVAFQCVPEENQLLRLNRIFHRLVLFQAGALLRLNGKPKAYIFDLFLHGFPPFPGYLYVFNYGELFEVAQSIPKSCLMLRRRGFSQHLVHQQNHQRIMGKTRHCHSGKDLMCCILLGHNHVVLSPAMLPAVSRQCTKKRNHILNSIEYW